MRISGNPGFGIRNPMLYPLSYGGIGGLFNVEWLPGMDDAVFFEVVEA